MNQNKTWNAHWIWPEGKETEMNSFTYFRKEFEITEIDKSHTLYITADTRYRVYLNGQAVGYGPPLCVSHYQYYDVYEVTDQLSHGVNCIAVEVYQLGVVQGATSGFLCELTDGEGHTIFRTDEHWKAIPAEAWRRDTHYFWMSMYSPFQEHFDANKVPNGWMDPGFIDDRWFPTQIIKGKWGDRPPAVLPWSMLVQRDIPHMRETPRFAERVESVEESIDLLNRMRSEDLSISLSVAGQSLQYAKVEQAERLLEQTGDTWVQSSINHLVDPEFDGMYYPCIVLDFGSNMNAFLELELSGDTGGIVDIGYAERLINGHFNNAIEGMFADRYVMKGGRQKFRPFTWKSFRYVKLTFRCPTPVQVHKVQATMTEYPYVSKGRFHSNDETRADYTDSAGPDFDSTKRR